MVQFITKTLELMQQSWPMTIYQLGISLFTIVVVKSCKYKITFQIRKPTAADSLLCQSMHKSSFHPHCLRHWPILHCTAISVPSKNIFVRNMKSWSSKIWMLFPSPGLLRQNGAAGKPQLNFHCFVALFNPQVQETSCYCYRAAQIIIVVTNYCYCYCYRPQIIIVLTNISPFQRLWANTQ